MEKTVAELRRITQERFDLWAKTIESTYLRANYEGKVEFNDDVVLIKMRPQGTEIYTATQYSRAVEVDGTLVLYPTYGGGRFDFSLKKMRFYAFEYWIEYAKIKKIKSITLGRGFECIDEITFKPTYHYWDGSAYDVLRGMGFRFMKGKEKYLKILEEIQSKVYSTLYNQIEEDILEIDIESYSGLESAIKSINTIVEERNDLNPSENIRTLLFTLNAFIAVNVQLANSFKCLLVGFQNGEYYVKNHDDGRQTYCKADSLKQVINEKINEIYADNRLSFLINPPTSQLGTLMETSKFTTDDTKQAMLKLMANDLDCLEVEKEIGLFNNNKDSTLSVARFGVSNESIIVKILNKYLVAFQFDEDINIQVFSDKESVEKFIIECHDILLEKTLKKIRHI